MIRPDIVLGIARAEARLTRRVFRFWVFGAISTLFAAIAFGWFLFIHWSFSFSSASAASAYPRFFMASFGSNFIFFFLFGLIFLGFDIRARDKRERMVEVLDTLPFSNTELVLGKFLGILIPSWVAVLGITAVLGIAGAALGAPLEPYSMVSFVFLMAIPAYTFFLGLVFFFASVLRHRLLVALATLSLLVLIWAASQWWVPLYTFPLLDVTGGWSQPFPSDIIPSVTNLAGFMQRAGFMVMGLGLLWLAAATHRRADDGSRGRRAGIGVVGLLLGATLCSVQVIQAKSGIDRKAVWKAVHEQANTRTAPDMLALSGEVRIEPGKRIDTEIELSIAAPGPEPIDEALFSLNPGMRVESIVDDSGRALSFTHADGLLTVELARPLGDSDSQTLALVASGTPDPAFAYLDALLEPFALKGSNAVLLLLGYEPSVFKSRFVALLPGSRWLPATGTDVGRGDPRERPLDFYDVDITVELPEGWLAAGPGRRREAPGAGSGKARFRFAPGAPVPEVALVAGRFESRSTEIDGVQLEMLVHRAHADVFDTFDDATDELTDWLSEKLTEASGFGLGYPYDGLTMVEVPNELRGFGGGWRMDSTMIQPAMVLMRESGFPTARFSKGFANPQRFEERDGGLPRRKREVLETFFENDMNGGNPFIAAARSFFGYQTAGSGPEGLPLDFVFESLSSRLITGRKGYFSYRIFDQNFGQDFMEAGQESRNRDRIGETYNDVLIHRLTSRPEVWEAILEASLVDMDPWVDPEQTIDVLALKGGAMAQSMLDDLGREKTGEFLGALRASTVGGAFTREDVLAGGEQVGEDVSTWLDTWLETTDLPGFMLAGVSVERIHDAEDGTPRYQSLVTVRNGEQVPGLLRLDYRVGEGRKSADRGSSDPVRVPAAGAVEIGLITSQQPSNLRVSPYLALNRDPFNVPLPGVDEERIVDAEPFIGAREVEWNDESEAIVVDDLDPGFRLESGDGGGMRSRVAGRGGDKELDQGLPVSESTRPARWSRMAHAYAHGKYRHTLAVVRGGKGEYVVSFAVDLPAAGRWDLEYHLPWSADDSRRKRDPGTWAMTLVDSSGDQEITFDADGADSGWNTLGTFEVADGEVALKITNETEGKYVVADAIRWSPADGGAVAAQ